VFQSASFLAWENALEKLKALDYESKFCRPNNLQPFTRSFFAIPADNPGLQFRSFNEIVSWLFGAASQGKNASPYVADKVRDN
jgi:hypothetical protein